MVELKNLYLLIDATIMNDCLNGEENIYYCYYPENHKLLIAPVSASYFPKIHKCVSTFLKLRSAQGTRSFQLTNIFSGRLPNVVVVALLNQGAKAYSPALGVGNVYPLKNTTILTVFL